MDLQNEQVELFRAVEVKEIEEHRELRGYTSFIDQLINYSMRN